MMRVRSGRAIALAGPVVLVLCATLVLPASDGAGRNGARRVDATPPRGPYAGTHAWWRLLPRACSGACATVQTLRGGGSREADDPDDLDSRAVAEAMAVDRAALRVRGGMQRVAAEPPRDPDGVRGAGAGEGDAESSASEGASGEAHTQARGGGALLGPGGGDLGSPLGLGHGDSPGDAWRRLHTGSIDGAAVFGEPFASIVQQLLKLPGWRCMSPRASVGGLTLHLSPETLDQRLLYCAPMQRAVAPRTLSRARAVTRTHTHTHTHTHQKQREERD